MPGAACSPITLMPFPGLRLWSVSTFASVLPNRKVTATSCLLLLLGAWVAVSPWVWGYHDVSSAVATDLVTGGAIIVLTLVAIAHPPFIALAVPAGLWLVLAPWIVGYGDEGGPVGLSDAIAGVAIAGLAIAMLSAAGRRRRPDSDMPIGRVQRHPDQPPR
jgi:SPW repeat-containing protein